MKLWQEKILVIPSNSAIYERGFWKQKFYQVPLASFIRVGHLGCLDANIIMQDTVEKFGLEGIIWPMTQHEEAENPKFGLNCVRSLDFSTFIYERMWFDLQFYVKD